MLLLFIIISSAAVLLFLLSLDPGGESVPSPLQGELRQHGVVFTEEKGTTAAAGSAGREETSSTAVERGSKEKQDGDSKRRRFSEMQLGELDPGRDAAELGFHLTCFGGHSSQFRFHLVFHICALYFCQCTRLDRLKVNFKIKFFFFGFL